MADALERIVYDDLLKLFISGGAHLVGFKDDLAVVVVARLRQALEHLQKLVLVNIDD